MVNKTSRTFNEVSRNYFSAPNQKRVRWKNVERVRSPEIRSKLIYLNNLVSINSDTAEQTLSVILKFSLDSWASRPPSGGERARSARQSGASLRLMLLAEWGSWWVFGSQLRLSKAETLLHFRLAEFQVPLDTESRSYNRPKLSVDLSTGSSGLYITRLRVKNVRPVSPVERLPISTGNLSRGIMVWRFWVSFIPVVCRAESAFICGYRSKGVMEGLV